ncbi:MAG: T9SS type A sorting domain-containing protein, partial [Calditrichaceae bacterium]|nr:T9SS type A sorting domain-containing protein [Calditrichaceae bacterium]
SATPSAVFVELLMGKDATGTAWFDNIDCNTNAGWTMGVFNGDCETPVGWMNWSTENGFANFVTDTAYSGTVSALLEENDTDDDEMVFYSEPAEAEEGKWYLISAITKSEGINTADGMHASYITPDRDNDRMGLCFFFHKAPIKTDFETVGGDQYVYIDQRTGKENQDWTKIMAIQKAPEEAAGVSMRARFTSFPTGKVWYDDFSIQEVTVIETAIKEYGNGGVKVATEYMLENNYPNPFNPITNIEYYVPNAGQVTMVVYNVLGQKVKTLVNRHLGAGKHYAIWDGLDDNGNMVSSGIYFYQLRGKGAAITKKMTFLK